MGEEKKVRRGFPIWIIGLLLVAAISSGGTYYVVNTTNDNKKTDNKECEKCEVCKECETCQTCQTCSTCKSAEFNTNKLTGNYAKIKNEDMYQKEEFSGEDDKTRAFYIYANGKVQYDGTKTSDEAYVKNSGSVKSVYYEPDFEKMDTVVFFVLFDGTVEQTYLSNLDKGNFNVQKVSGVTNVDRISLYIQGGEDISGSWASYFIAISFDGSEKILYEFPGV